MIGRRMSRFIGILRRSSHSFLITRKITTESSPTSSSNKPRSRTVYAWSPNRSNPSAPTTLWSPACRTACNWATRSSNCKPKTNPRTDLPPTTPPTNNSCFYTQVWTSFKLTSITWTNCSRFASRLDPPITIRIISMLATIAVATGMAIIAGIEC